MPSKPITMDAVYTAPGYLFRRMQQIAVALFVEECKAYDLTPVQYAALVAIHTHPGIDATRLSAVIAFDRSTLGNVIERLESKAFIARKPAREDKRVKLLYLTKAGAATLRDILPSVERAQARPERHVFVASKAPWYDIADALPRFKIYPGFEPEDDAPAA